MHVSFKGRHLLAEPANRLPVRWRYLQKQQTILIVNIQLFTPIICVHASYHSTLQRNSSCWLGQLVRELLRQASTTTTQTCRWRDEM